MGLVAGDTVMVLRGGVVVVRGGGVTLDFKWRGDGMGAKINTQKNP